MLENLSGRLERVRRVERAEEVLETAWKLAQSPDRIHRLQVYGRKGTVIVVIYALEGEAKGLVYDAERDSILDAHPAKTLEEIFAGSWGYCELYVLTRSQYMVDMEIIERKAQVQGLREPLKPLKPLPAKQPARPEKPVEEAGGRRAPERAVRIASPGPRQGEDIVFDETLSEMLGDISFVARAIRSSSLVHSSRITLRSPEDIERIKRSILGKLFDMVGGTLEPLFISAVVEGTVKGFARGLIVENRMGMYMEYIEDEGVRVLRGWEAFQYSRTKALEDLERLLREERARIHPIRIIFTIYVLSPEVEEEVRERLGLPKARGSEKRRGRRLLGLV